MVVQDTTDLPAPLVGLVEHIAQNPDIPMSEIMEPYRQYEAGLRTSYAQDRSNPALNDPYLNVVPLFNDVTKSITVRARDLAAESDEEKSKYVMALPDEKRLPHGSPATVANITEFQKNFNLFSESSLVEIDWNNVVAAGSSVVNCLLPVPQEFNISKRKLREYYHQKFCPASDVDLFLYGLTHDQAIEKIKQIEQSVRDALLNEVTVVRTKYALTIASQYPVRHVQIVLRVYKSVSEILTGFDIDAAGGAYDGKQVYVTPRALGSFITQINHIDLSRRSPSYENRLSKYSHRNFEVYWPELDRSRVDPTIFERSFKRTLGLARLLVLERLPTNQARETYLNKRRMERGRPTVERNYFSLHGNIKGQHEDEVADWLSDEDLSNYHTFTVPYGEKFNAKRIEKLCYTRDLLLNAEWNQPKERDVYLHRHPAFFGRVEDIIEDCCGYCPKPVTPDEIEVSKKESEIYISGKVSFLIDDPGRQQIGSFNPLTEQDWTDMAYVGNTARLCQSIVDGDFEDVLNWLSQEDADPNQRDYTGRAPLHLAAMVSTPEIAECLIQHGARLTARLADGKTALHLAAARGSVEIVRTLMEKSLENEHAEEERQTSRRKSTVMDVDKEENDDESVDDGESAEDSDVEMIDGAETEADQSMVTGSYVKVKGGNDQDGDIVPVESDDEPDYYQIDVLAWDTPCSPLHLAIASGHENVVETLCDYGADSILPVKFLSTNSHETGAILTLALALSLPKEKAKSMALLLLKLGATSSQADSNGCTAFHRYVENGATDLVDILLEADKTGTKSSINHLLFSGYYHNAEVIAPLHTAVEHGDPILVLKLLNAGAVTQIDFDTWLKSAKVSPSASGRLGDFEQNQKIYESSVEQPFIAAIHSGELEVAMQLLEHGADPNCLTSSAKAMLVNEWQRSYQIGMAALDIVESAIKQLGKYTEEKVNAREPIRRPGLDTYLDKFVPGTYRHWVVYEDILFAKKNYQKQKEAYDKASACVKATKGAAEKKSAIQDTILALQTLKTAMVAKGGKAFADLYPDIKTGTERPRNNNYYRDDSQSKPYEYLFTFSNDRDMTETRRDGYIELMEAAWAGDLDRIKLLTLQAWGPLNDQPPLKMAITDTHNFSPFSLAFLQGHHAVARAILDIVKTQWSPSEKKDVRYKMREENSEDGTEDEDDSEYETSQPDIELETINQTFTIDNIGEVSMQVQSHTKPLSVICDHCPGIFFDNGQLSRTAGRRSLFEHVLDVEDTAGLKFLLDTAQHFSADKYIDDEDDSAGSFTFPMETFRWAVESGKTQLLGLVIKRTGAGLPLDDLVKKSGVQLEKKPRYYQGLTVYGKKRNDWATAGRNMGVRTTGLKSPPLLHAALGGHIDSVEFFLGDTPHRLYSEFGKSKAGREEARLKHLKETKGGFDRAVAKWLGADNEFVIHCTVLGAQSDHACELLEYLVQTYPVSLEKKSSAGDTPLLMAFRLGRTRFAKILINGNADQSTKNLKNENVIHAAVAGNPMASQLRPLLDLLDPGLRRHLMLQRKSLLENGTTPLHTWISQACGLSSGDSAQYSHYYYPPPKPYKRDASVVDMANLLLEYSGGDELDMLNGAGETCLHTSIMHDMISLVKVLVDAKPEILRRENAVGRTPAEVAHDRFTAQQLAQPGSISYPRDNKLEELSKRTTAQFFTEASMKGTSPEQLKALLESIGLSDDYDAAVWPQILRAVGTSTEWPTASALDGKTLKRVIWDFCRTAMERYAGHRRLVSLNEANDVARRLGEKHTGSRYYAAEAKTGSDDGQAVEEDEKADRQDFASERFNMLLAGAWHGTDRPDEEVDVQDDEEYQEDDEEDQEDDE